MNQDQPLTVETLREWIIESGQDTEHWLAYLLARVLNVERALAAQAVLSQPPSRIATAQALAKPLDL